MGSAELNSPAVFYPVFSSAGTHAGLAPDLRWRRPSSSEYRLAAVGEAVGAVVLCLQEPGPWQGSSLFGGHRFHIGSCVLIVFVLMLDHDGAYKRASSLLAFARLSASCESRSKHSGSSCLQFLLLVLCFPAGSHFWRSLLFLCS